MPAQVGPAPAAVLLGCCAAIILPGLITTFRATVKENPVRMLRCFAAIILPGSFHSLWGILMVLPPMNSRTTESPGIMS